MAVSLFGVTLGIIKHSKRPLQVVLRSSCLTSCHQLSTDSPKPPKRPENAFLRYIRDHRPEVKMANPGISVKEVTKLLGAQWRQLTDQEKQPYREQTVTEMMKWEKENAVFQESLSAEQKEELKKATNQKRVKKQKSKQKKLAKEMEKPKQPPNGYIMFILDSTAVRGDAPLMEFTKGRAEQWKRMPEEDKLPYLNLAAKKREEYQKELREWEDLMIQEGHPELVRQGHQLVSPKKKKPKKTASKVKKKKATINKITKTGKAKTTSKNKSAEEVKPEDVQWMREE